MSGLQSRARGAKRKTNTVPTLAEFGFGGGPAQRQRIDAFSGHICCNYCGKLFSPQGHPGHVRMHKARGDPLMSQQQLRGLRSGAVSNLLCASAPVAASAPATASNDPPETEKQCTYCGVFIDTEDGTERYKMHQKYHTDRRHHMLKDYALSEWRREKVIIYGSLDTVFANGYAITSAMSLATRERMRVAMSPLDNKEFRTQRFTAIASIEDLNDSDSEEEEFEELAVRGVQEDMFSDDDSNLFRLDELEQLPDNIDSDSELGSVVETDDNEGEQLISESLEPMVEDSKTAAGPDKPNNLRQPNIDVKHKRTILKFYDTQVALLGETHGQGQMSNTVKYAKRLLDRPSFHAKTLRDWLANRDKIEAAPNAKARYTGKPKEK